MTEAGMRSTCPYCGVGCGVVARPDGSIVGDAAHPSNRGRLCSKGAALAPTLGAQGRLLRPRMDGAETSWDAALDRVADRFATTIAEHGPESVAFYVSGQCLTEDYYVANKLMKGFIGSANIDTNSRLCMASSVAAHVRAFGEDVVPGLYEDWDQADLVVLVGSNAAWCHPVLHQRLLAARAARGTRIVVIDPRRTATAEMADLHLQIAAGTDIAVFNGLLAHLHATGAVDRVWTERHTTGLDAAIAAARLGGETDRVAATCGIDEEALQTFYDWFAATERVVTAFSQGVNQSAVGTDKANAIINCHLATGRIGRPGMGPFSLTGQPNAMGGREVGGLANQLAAHLRLDDAAQRDMVRRFWDAPAMATRPGLKAVELFDAVADGRVRAVWIVATNPAVSLPRADHVRAALAACPFVVVSDCWDTDTTALADVVLPAAGWGEKDGTVTSSERRISRQRAFRPPPGEARADWRMFADVAARMGFADGFAWDGPAAVFREHAALSGFENADSEQAGRRVFDISGLAGLDDAAYDAMPPVCWPLPQGAAGEGGRLFATGGFPTPDGRARLIAVTDAGAPHAQGQPFLLNTGRIRDQWHTMTRTGRVVALMAHVPEPRLAIHPADADRLGIEPDGLTRIDTADGHVMLRAELTHAQRRGEVFAPMHWTDEFASTGPVARAVSARVDPHSGQPELKATPARLARVAVALHGLLLRRDPGALPAQWHWTRTPIATGHAYRLACLDAPADHAALRRLAAGLLPDVADAQWLEMSDQRRGVLRIAALRDDRLEACLWLAADPARVPGADIVAPLLGEAVPPAQRAALLAGRIAGASDEGRQVCTCFGVGLNAIRHAIATHHLRTPAAIGAHLRAGTNCGSCVPELEAILRDVAEPAL